MTRTARRPPPAVTTTPTTAALLDRLEGVVVKPEVMRGYFGGTVAPRFAREVLRREWQSCRDGDAGVHLTATIVRGGRAELAGAGFLFDGEVRYFVAPDARRRGVGRALLAALRSAASDRRLPTITAWIFPDNTASAGLLSACGFVQHGAMHVMPYGSLVPRQVLQYRLALDPAPGLVFGASAAPGGTTRP